jgi:hypothetical protein
LSEGAVHERLTEALPAVAVGAPGATGTPAGVTAVEAEEYELVPAAFIAAILNTYEVPLVRPVTVADVVALVPSANVVQLDPLLLEY